MRTTRFSPRVLLLGGAMVFTAAIAAHGQSTPQPQPVDFAAVRKDLRNFITAQEVYFTDHNAYATAVGSLDFTPSEGVTIKLIETGLMAYSASGAIAGKSGASCVVFVGSVAAVPKTERGVAAKAEGRPLCDGDPLTGADQIGVVIRRLVWMDRR